MNTIVNKFLLVVDKFMPEMHLKQPGITYSACDPLTKNKERIEKFMQTVNTNFIYKNELHFNFNLISVLFSTRYSLWQIKRFSKKKTIRYSFKR